MKRLEEELFEEPPPFMIRTMLRWMLQDPEYQRRFSLFLGRAIPPHGWRSPSLVLGAMARGAMRDLGRMIRREAA